MKLIPVMCAAALASGGCSIALQEHKADGMIGRRAAETCSASRTLPWVDMGMMSASLTSATVLAATHDGTFGSAHNNDALQVAAGVSALVGLLYYASADMGFKRARTCDSPASTATALR